MLKDAKCINYSDLKGHCVLTSGQIRGLLDRMRPPRPDYEYATHDMTLLESYLILLQNTDPVRYPELKKNVDIGLHDPKCTKHFKHWEVTEEQINGYMSEESDYNFSHLRSYRNALRIASDLVGKPSLKPLPVYRGMDVSKCWSNPDASAGAIGKGSKKDNEALCFDAFEKLVNGIRRKVPFTDLQIPAIPAHRAQISGFYNPINYDDFTYYGNVKQKDRLVWIIDGGTNLLEAQYGIPYQEYLSKHVVLYAGGKTPEVMRGIISTMSQVGVKWLSLDYSGYDQTVPAKVIHDVFKHLIRPCFPKSAEDELKFIEYNFIHTKMLLTGNRMVVKHRGIPSGSDFTQIVGSLCNLVIGLTYICSVYDASGEDIDGYVRRVLTYPGTRYPMISVMGDDNIWGLLREINKEDWAEYVNKVFNMKIHAEKCADWKTMKFPEYLKRQYTPSGEKMNLLYIILNTCSPEYGERSYDGYSPWHIIYGMFFTYRASFNNPHAVEVFLVRKMRESGGLDTLKTLNPRELPGVLRGFSNKARSNLYLRAKAIERQYDLAS